MLAKQQEKHTLYRKKTNRTGWKFISIALVLLLLLNIYPVMNSLYLSFFSGKGIVLKFNGLGNIIRLFSDEEFKISLFNTLVYLIVQVPIMIFLALILATLLNHKKLRYKGIFRTAIFLPCVTSLVAYSLLFKSMFSYDGIFNIILMKMHIISTPIPWLSDSFWAKVTIIIAITWRWTGYNMIFYLAALQNIDKSVYEAAEIDGANWFKKFFHITVPLLKPLFLPQ